MLIATMPVAPYTTLLTATVVGMALLLGAAAPAQAQAGSGLTALRLGVPAGPSLWRQRLSGFGTPADGPGLGTAGDPGWRLLGSVDLPRGASGLRASGGMIGVSRRTALGNAILQESQRWDSGLTSGWIEGTHVSDLAAQATRISVPYAGIGYSAGTATTGPRGLVSSSWSFSVDLGVMALAPRSQVRFGAPDGGQSRLDDLVRELRLSPLLQLGVTYSF